MAASGSHDTVCPICKEDFQDPVFIQCHHSFCRSCIGDWIRCNARHRQFDCPVCKEVNTLPKSGVTGLKKCFYIQQIRDAVRGVMTAPLYPNCERHPFEDLRFYCLNCNIAACRDCKVTGHENHRFESLSILAEEKRQDLYQIANASEEHLKCITEIKNELTLIRKDILEQRSSLIKKLYRQAGTLKASIDKLAKITEYEIRRKFKPVLQNNSYNFNRVYSKQNEIECFIDSVNNLTDSRTNDFDVVSKSEWVSKLNHSFEKPVEDSDIVYCNYQNMFCVGQTNEKALKDMLGTVQINIRSQVEQKLDYKPAHDNEQTTIHPLPPLPPKSGLRNRPSTPYPSHQRINPVKRV